MALGLTKWGSVGAYGPSLWIGLLWSHWGADAKGASWGGASGQEVQRVEIQ